MSFGVLRDARAGVDHLLDGHAFEQIRDPAKQGDQPLPFGLDLVVKGVGAEVVQGSSSDHVNAAW